MFKKRSAKFDQEFGVGCVEEEGERLKMLSLQWSFLFLSYGLVLLLFSSVFV